ncbi:DUF551 domain-containing protein [Citrobacter freundii]|nr:DUF551 domain-containing protein [Citrobacter freundii]EJD6625125.1 DUF551 domain-containing protein [Citrobacter freundii]
MTTPITKERVAEIIHAAGLEPCDYEEVFSSIKTGEIVKMARIALAAMDADPVAWLWTKTDGERDVTLTNPSDDEDCHDAILSGWGHQPLYAAPPAMFTLPVQHWEELCRQNPNMSIGDAIIRAAWWNHCAAMLQGGKSEQLEPVSNRDELPLDYLQGHKDGLEWAAQLAEANHPQTGDWLYDDPIELAKAIRKGPDMPEGGNSPVIPDAWIKCSERMPTKQYGTVFLTWNGQYIGKELFLMGSFQCLNPEIITHWMPLPAAPQQEVNP